MTIVKERNFNNNSDFVFISNNETYDDIISLSIDEFINNGCVGGVAYGIAIKEGIQRNVIEMIDNKRMIIDKELSISDLNNILNKYINDRNNLINNGSYKMIELIPGNICSSKYKLDGDRLKIYLSLKPNNLEFDDYEISFIKYLIDTLFEGQIIYHRSRLDNNVMRFHLVGDNDNLCIKLTHMANFNLLFMALINNHNINIRENMNRKYE